MRKIFGSALMVCLLVFAMITLGCSNGSTAGGGLDARFIGTWVKDSEPTTYFTVEHEDNGIFYSFEFYAGQSWFKYALRKNGDVFSFHDTSLKAVFEGEKLRVSEAKGYVGGSFNGLYIKTP